jgi:hypothetical protein
MSKEQRELEKIVMTRVLRLNATIHGIVFGLVVGTAIFAATNWLVVKGGPVIGPNLGLLDNFFIGYEVTFWGSIVGFAYGMAIGFGLGYFVARAYNWIVDKRDGTSG